MRYNFLYGIFLGALIVSVVEMLNNIYYTGFTHGKLDAVKKRSITKNNVITYPFRDEPLITEASFKDTTENDT